MTVGLGGIVGVMQELGFELSVITQVVSVLDDGCEAVDRARHLNQIDATSFGDLDEGMELARHTDLAREKVREALHDMVTGLGSYREALMGLVAESMAVEDDTVSSLQRIEQGEACVVTPSFAAPSQCGPGSEG